MHRSKALDEWWRLARGESISLERALGSFDLFVLHDQSGDILEACSNYHGVIEGTIINMLSADLRSPRPAILALAK